ncbi:ubiquinol-cytochrome c reductase complex assembly factor 6 isoform X1 [Homo sapiens]|uniref:ubiquinol-cytochrome c reductase complex assembly factor 6 isoform X1 n=1 Tax=Homo sapiens TaxID=9606 RepID=UPI0005D0389F|nr:ubiquinol-cytochrome-c reductase complex assembly factor 6 isoform X1 [Homo sapiens]XP_054229103.1 ubiquinol-cytochrome-c reductase complex assembly factor 6 isoform X1 [Homo sapiens]|eukprot:XP_011537020.1 uncharacterized protein C12orf73 isoform X1 [Homo sapiens]
MAQIITRMCCYAIGVNSGLEHNVGSSHFCLDSAWTDEKQVEKSEVDFSKSHSLVRRFEDLKPKLSVCKTGSQVFRSENWKVWAESSRGDHDDCLDLCSVLCWGELLQTIPEIPPKRGELKTELLGLKERKHKPQVSQQEELK